MLKASSSRAARRDKVANLRLEIRLQEATANLLLIPLFVSKFSIALYNAEF
jgi:hypothetical protein